jgi:cytochrome c-type biogenesis protein
MAEEAESDVYAPSFTAVDADGRAVSLNDFSGKVLLLHITNIENPICVECEPALKGQTSELAALSKLISNKTGDSGNLSLLTLNIRKSPYSKDGRTLSERWWHLNINWNWVEEFEPFPIAGGYSDFTTIGSGFANPTLILIDKQGRVSKVYHVYLIGKGEVDGVQNATLLYSDMIEAQRSPANAKVSRQKSDVTYVGMFFLGIATSLAPCSIALMIAVITYIMTTVRRERTSRRREGGAFGLATDRSEGSDAGMAASTEGLMIGVAFTLGMGLVFFIIGLFISSVGVFIREARLFDLIAGIIMILLGINAIKPADWLIPRLSAIVSGGREDLEEGGSIAAEPIDMPVRKSAMERMVDISIDLFRHSAFIGAFSLGAFFALGWAPCALSLVFPVLIWLASQDVSPLYGGLMLLLFGIGHGVPIIPISAFSRTVAGKIGDRYIAAGRYLTAIFGAAIIVVGIVYAARYFGIAFW